MKAFNKIFATLGLSENNGLFILSENKWKEYCNFSKRVEYILEFKIIPDAFFYFNDTPFILFFDNPVDEKKLHQQIWNFNQSPVIFINSGNQLQIYNGFSFIKESGNKHLEKLTDLSHLNDFSFFKLVTGETWEKYQQQLHGKHRVDEKLLENIKTLRNQLTKSELPAKTANNLIGRVLFIRYLIDREVRIGEKTWTNNDLCLLLQDVDKTYSLFERLKSKQHYNGDLFPFEPNERNDVKAQHLQQIINLLEGTDLTKGQRSLFDIYDFSIIPVELISHVYEYFIGIDNQASKGAYYTPLFLVNYILNETVGNYFEQNPNEYNCQVLDPSCGSGIFLVETLRKIIFRYKALHPNCEKDKKSYHTQLKKLLTDNIFGVDIDPNAINVAIFSLYITLLDFIDKPTDIEDFKFPNLLNTNFFESDSFDTEASFNTVLKKKRLDFIIGNPPWGNLYDPKNKKNLLYHTYWKNREKEETLELREQIKDTKAKVEIGVSNKEIAQAFLIRTKDFSTKTTKCALIVTSKILYNLQADKFRQYFLKKNAVQKVLELSSVRHEVFDKSNDKAIAPTSVIFYESHKNNITNYDNIVHHISLKPNRFFELFKLFVIEKFDYKYIPQHMLMNNDWLWKTLVFGNILDFHFVKRLRSGQSIFDVISDKKRFIFGKGICIKGGDQNTINHLKRIKNGINTKEKALKPFFIKYSENFIKNLEYVHRPRNPELYKAPFLLIKKGVTKNYKVVSALSLTDAVFTDSCTSIKALDKKDISTLRQLSGIFASDLFSYFLIMIASSVGIEREQIHDEKEKFAFPFKQKSDFSSSKEKPKHFRHSKQITYLVEKLENLNKEKFEKRLPILDIGFENKENEIFNLLENEINSLYSSSNQEQDILNYALDVTVPMLQEKKKYKYIAPIKLDKIGKVYLEQYATIFTKHFDNLFKSSNKTIQVNIYYSRYTIGVEFCVVNSYDNKYNFISDKTSQAILNKFAVMTYQQVSKDLFIQKDIKGFEEESFYVIKPNEYKCWHRAIAHLDLGEFLEAMLTSNTDNQTSKEHATQ